MRVYLTTTVTPDHRLGRITHDVLNRVKAAVEQDQGYALADSPRSADAVLFIESPHHKFRDYVDVLLTSEPLRLAGEKSFAYDWSDAPTYLLPGLYPNVNKATWLRKRGHVRSFCMLDYYNDRVLSVTPLAGEPRFLFTFSGSRSHPVRDEILRLDSEGACLRESEGWFTHTDDEKAAYAQEIAESRFAICPRGIGPSSHRLFEVMALGRAPVIVADDWVEPLGPDWSEFSLRVPEMDVRGIPDLLESRRRDWREMGRAAQSAYERWFSPQVAPTRLVENVHEMLTCGFHATSTDDLAAEWRGLRCAWEHGWTMPQRLVQSYRAGTLGTRLREHARRLTP